MASGRVELTVRGGGAFGLSIAFEAARRGARVRLIEARRIGAGSSGGTVGALAPHVPENWNPKKQFQFESLRMAEGFWTAAREAGGKDAGYARTGRVQPLMDAAQVARAQERAAQAATLWQGFAEWRVVEGGDLGPLAPAAPSGFYVFDTLTARAAPRAAGASLAAAIEALGGEIVLGEAEEIGPVIHATGAEGVAELSRTLGKSVGGGVKGQSALLRYDAPDAPQVYAESLHVVPHADGTVAIGSTSEREFEDGAATDAQLDALVEKARRLCPALADAPVIDRWAGVRPRAKSRAPMLGAWPGRPSHFIANGGFKIGFGMAPKVAQTMVDLVLEGRDAIPEGFRVEDNL